MRALFGVYEAMAARTLATIGVYGWALDGFLNALEPPTSRS